MTTGPKSTRSTLDVVNNTYVVRNGLLYEYYPISVLQGKDSAKFMRLGISPGVMSPGIAIVDKELYDVSVDDLFRRRINVANRHQRSNVDATVNKSDVPAKKGKNTSKTQGDPNKQGSSKVFGIEVSKAADVAWENQTDALLQAIFAKEGEEFEITGSSQSGQSDEGSSASDMFNAVELD